jgi:hypothetical protein
MDSLTRPTKNPDPLKEFCQDLNDALKKWKQTNHEIILMIDANEEIGKKPGGIGKVMADNGLYDIMANQHHTETYPPSYARGTKRIDYIFGTEQIQTHCKTSGILPLNIGYPSDHQAVFLRVDLQSIMSTIIHPNIPDKLQTDNKYTMEVLKHIAQRKQLPEIDTYLTPDEVARGFKKWRESTSTSPSGCHLGLC